MTDQTREPKPSSKITAIRPAGDDHQVLTIAGGSGGYCKRPCADCPWRVDATGIFPAEAFRHSAGTAYDMARHTFACHQSGKEQPRVCAGFLLRGGEHNLSVRLGRMEGLFNDVVDGGHALHETYRAMAIANGVEPDEVVLAPCR